MFRAPTGGPGPRLEVTQAVLKWLRDERGVKEPSIERADEKLVSDLRGHPEFKITATREHFDYLYLSENLIKLSGNRYHGKKNHMNKFRKTYEFSYAPLARKHQGLPGGF